MSSTKHIIILHPHFTLPGGAGTFVLEVGQRLVDQGYKVSVISMRSTHKRTNKAPGVRFIDVRGPLTDSFWFWLLYPYWYWKVQGMITTLKPDVLFPQVFPAHWWALLYKVFHPSTRVVWMCQEPSAFIHSAKWINAIHQPLKRYLAKILKVFLKPLDLYLVRKSDKVLANSKYSRGIISSTYSLEENSISVIYPGVEEKPRHASQVTTREPIVITISRLTKFKNIDLLITAFSHFVTTTKGKWHFKIVGDGEERAALQQLIDSLHAGDRITLTGVLNDAALQALLHKSKVFVSSAVDEPFGISILEASSAGLVVIAHNSGGPKETVINDETGILVNKLTVEDYTVALQKITSSRTLQESFSHSAQEFARQFNWNKSSKEVAKHLFPSNQ